MYDQNIDDIEIKKHFTVNQTNANVISTSYDTSSIPGCSNQ